MWAPFFGAGHLVAAALHARHPDVSIDGTSFPYRQAVCVASLVYGLLGCWFAWRFTRRVLPDAPAAAAVTLTMAGSFMLWYLVKEPSMTHAASMASVAAFSWAWAATRARREPAAWAMLGLLMGLAALIRWQNVLFALLPGIDAAVGLWRGLRTGDRAAVRRTAIGSLLFLAAMLVGFLPQMLAWKAIYGSFSRARRSAHRCAGLDPHLTDILWSARNGLFSTSPLLYLAGLGLILRHRHARNRRADHPGDRGDDLLQRLHPGLVGQRGLRRTPIRRHHPVFLRRDWPRSRQRVTGWTRRHPGGAVMTALGLVAVWNLTLMGAAQDGAIRIGETTPFDRAWALRPRSRTAGSAILPAIPPTYLYALRNGVWPGRLRPALGQRFLADPLTLRPCRHRHRR